MIIDSIFTKDKIFWLFLIVAFVLKITFGLFIFTEENIIADARDYLEFAQLILRDGPFVPNHEEIEAFAPPGFPWLLAFTIWMTGNINGIIFFNALFSAFTVGIVYKIGHRFLPGNWGVLPALWALIYYPYTMYVDELVKESLLQFLVPLSILFLIRLKEKRNFIRMIFLALAVTYLFHSDERYFLFVPLYFIYLVYPIGDSGSFKTAVITGLLILLFCIPWFYRNYQVYDRSVFLTERFQSPIDRILGNKENRLLVRSREFKQQLVNFRDSVKSGLNPEPTMGRERAIREAMDKGFFPHDFSLLERIYYNSYGYWSPIRTNGILLRSGWKYKGPRSFITNVLYTLNYGVLLPFMLLGVYFAWRNRIWILAWLSVYLFCHYILHIILIFGSGRYRHPVDFIIILLAFYGLYELIKLKDWPLFRKINLALK